MSEDEKKKSFWSRVWHHASFHSNDPYSKNIEKEDVLPILLVLFVVMLILSMIVYFSF